MKFLLRILTEIVALWAVWGALMLVAFHFSVLPTYKAYGELPAATCATGSSLLIGILIEALGRQFEKGRDKEGEGGGSD